MISQHDFKWVNEQRKSQNRPPLSREEFSKLGLHDRNKFVDAAGLNAVGVRVLGDTLPAAHDPRAVRNVASPEKPKTQKRQESK